VITLKIYLDGEFKQKIKLLRDVETIGRSRSATLRLTDSTVSGTHAQIKKTSKGVIIKDLGSSNGTFVNDEKIDSHVLQMSDRIRIGNIGLKVYSIDTTAASTSNKSKKKVTTVSSKLDQPSAGDNEQTDVLPVMKPKA